MDFDTFKSQVARTTDPGTVPLADQVTSNVPIYDGDAVRAAANNPQATQALLSEWAAVFLNGPGVLVITRAISDTTVVDRATLVFEKIIEEQRGTGQGGGDHFAKPGANDRIWNAIEKHCLRDPENFADYFANDAFALACLAWLGPGYTVTAQVNRVNPGGNAQVPHRDYHLGFMTADQIDQYPAHIHQTSAQLTLQGAIAHCDMPVESGTTMLLPFSQIFADGYRQFGSAPFQDYFAQNHVQLPLRKGDMLFFNPALMHGAGENKTTDVFRMANLVQISSAFGRPMEAMDTNAMVAALYPVLASKDATDRAVQNAVAAATDGYPFPSNLDTDPASGGLAPLSQRARVMAALRAGDSLQNVKDMLARYSTARMGG